MCDRVWIYLDLLQRWIFQAWLAPMPVFWKLYSTEALAAAPRTRAAGSTTFSIRTLTVP